MVGRAIATILLIVGIGCLLGGAFYTAGALDPHNQASNPFAAIGVAIGVTLLGVGAVATTIGVVVARRVWPRPPRSGWRNW
ncbi:hypothetical protein GCM10009814_29380 [Lapillicoccus jejuensis]